MWVDFLAAGSNSKKLDVQTNKVLLKLWQQLKTRTMVLAIRRHNDSKGTNWMSGAQAVQLQDFLKDFELSGKATGDKWAFKFD